MFALYLFVAFVLYVLFPLVFWIWLSPIDDSSLISLLIILATFSLPLLLLSYTVKAFFLLYCQPVHFSEEGVRQGKASIAWNEITVHGMAQPFLPEDGQLNIPGKGDLIVYLAAGNPKAGLWSALGVISVWELLYVRNRMPRLYYKFFEEMGEPEDSSHSLASLYDENDLPEKMVWFKFDEKVYYECVKRIRQKTLTQIQ